jgi:hypothetical protein
MHSGVFGPSSRVFPFVLPLICPAAPRHSSSRSTRPPTP